MGTNTAPPWAQLLLRMFAILTPLPSNHFLNRYITDGCVTPSITPLVCSMLCGRSTPKTYHLEWNMWVKQLR